MNASLRVAINAQMIPGGGLGGVEQFMMGLVHTLGQLVDGPEEYIIVGPWQEPDWLQPYAGRNQRLVSGPRPQFGSREWVSWLLGPFSRPSIRLWRALRRLMPSFSRLTVPAVPVSDGFYESLGGDVVHFPYQRFVRCDLPAIYNPHDLQHLHYPRFFTPQEFALRETIYRSGCRHAQAVVVESAWVKSDVIRQYGIDVEKVHVIPCGSPTELYQPVTNKTLAEVRQRYELPEFFALYPAQTWAHKNHIRLLEAVKLLKDDHSLSVQVVCTGRQNDFWPTIQKHRRELKLEDQVRFLGFVSAEELRGLYHLAQFVVFPSLFEGGGVPVLEGFREGAPVACSDVTSLPEYGGDAVLLFDPTSVKSIASAMLRLATDAELRASLRRRGAERMRLFSWERAAKAYRALYRKVAGRHLSKEDLHLLAHRGPGREAAAGGAWKTNHALSNLE
jgi:glycosyltransferase involved in cell wall biosynthesis